MSNTFLPYKPSTQKVRQFLANVQISLSEERFSSFAGKDIKRDHDPIGKDSDVHHGRQINPVSKKCCESFIKIRFFQIIQISNNALKFKHKTNNVKSFKQKAQLTF